jgi:hypothetical protein
MHPLLEVILISIYTPGGKNDRGHLVMSSTLVAIRTVNVVLTAVGAVVFAAFFLYITVAPKDFDQRTRNFAIAKVKAKVDDQFSKAVQSKAANKATEFLGKYSERLENDIQKLRDSLDAGVAEFIADVLAAACKLDCERRDQAAKAVTAFYESMIARHGLALDRLRTLIEGEYDAIMKELRDDLRIFSGSSFAALLFAFVLSIFRGKAAAHLLPFSIALSAATFIAAIWYVFGQDWVLTMIYSTYWGWSYLVVLSAIFVFLIDIAVNRARITTTVLNRIHIGPGDWFDLTPC